MKKFASFCLALCFSSVAGFSALAHEMPIPKALPPEFAKVKKLEGHWEGTSQSDEKNKTVVADYKVTAGGSAVVETLFPGTAHEMISVYHPEGKGVVMSHYCLLGNHPKMTLKKADDNTLFFEMVGHDGIESNKEAHMHSLLITFKSPTEMTEEWINFENGKKRESAIFTFAKK
jgi:hypothetical protein